MEPVLSNQDGNPGSPAARPTTAFSTGFSIERPRLNLPKGGGALRSIGEKFATNPVSGAGAMDLQIATSPARGGTGPQLSLAYDSNGGNGPFGLGWQLSTAAITRKTSKGLPQYDDKNDSDVFILSGVEDLVPSMLQEHGKWGPDQPPTRSLYGQKYTIRRYRPRIEGGFSRLEYWQNQIDPSDAFWRSVSPDNATTWYGKTAASRIADPADASRIYSWLACESYDDRGNVAVFLYKPENSQGIDNGQGNERNRTDHGRAANCYLKHVMYGNRTPYIPTLSADSAATALPTDWCFEVLFDYGEHDALDPLPLVEAQPWPVRHDPFSTYRSAFEVRTYRRCQRVLMFHHFADEKNVGLNCLVRSTDFSYSEPPVDPLDPTYSFLIASSQTGYARSDVAGQAYTSKSLPPISFDYSLAVIDETVHVVDPASLQNLPNGLDQGRYEWGQWVDLDGEGLSGILSEQGGSWFYKANLSPANVQADTSVQAQFAPLQMVRGKPSLAALGGGHQQLLSLAGDGHLDLVAYDSVTPGYQRRNDNGGWEPYAAFGALPVLDWQNPNLKQIDLTGDGFPDLLISEDDAFCWHQSLAEDGFMPMQRVRQAWDEEQGPKLVLADGTETIFLADMSGDGLSDLVRIRNGEACYWPNLGYGRFGAKVSMDNAPLFEASNLFSGGRLRLADIDGSGTCDLVYFAGDSVQLYFNLSGNSWSQRRQLRAYPAVDSVSSAAVLDLLGNGTACLVWSSPLGGNGRRQMRYIDLMGGQKPHLLVKSCNNVGAETDITYAPSTRFYVEDKLAGRPWATRIPFPVHVVAQVEQRDLISGVRLTSQYRYRHGYFDGAEREFRGFAMVEQTDSESFVDYVAGVVSGGAQDTDPQFYQPPITTRSWFHTGAYLDRNRIVHQLQQEYYGQQSLTPEPVLPDPVTTDEWRECLRGLKGAPLHSEVYSFDGSPQQDVPFGISEHTYQIQLVQPKQQQRYAVVQCMCNESLTLHYERNPQDPRINHNFTLETDIYGNSLKTVTVTYGRQLTDASLPVEVSADQQKMTLVYAETDYTTDIDQDAPLSVYRLRVPYASRQYEITGIAPTAARFTQDELQKQIALAADIDYEVVATGGTTAQKRLLAQSNMLFMDNSLAPLPLGQRDTLNLSYQSYRLAFTPGVVAAYYGTNVSDAEFSAAGYAHFDGDNNWWMPSGIATYPANPANHFYLSNGSQDPLGSTITATFDQYDLLIEKIQHQQASWNLVSASNDYRILAPLTVTDPNQNRTAIAVDELGMLVATALMGKDGAGEGDTLADPTVRQEYQLFNWINNQQPNFVHSYAREKHGAENPRWQETYAYANGSGQTVLLKVQANPGQAWQVAADGSASLVDSPVRWIGNGRQVLNNKGQQVKQYEPYFSVNAAYEDEQSVREIGVTALQFYDVQGRNIRTRQPDGTLSRVEFDPWQSKMFDANDTVKESQWYANLGSPDPASQPEPSDPQQRAAWLAAMHADTPAVAILDSLGRNIYTIADYGGGTTAAVRSSSDLTGRFASAWDQLGREVAQSFCSMSGTPIYSLSADKGQRWTFVNALGGMVKSWDQYGRKLRTEYDALHRPVSAFAQDAGQPEFMFSHMVFGDQNPNGLTLNLLGAPHQVYDQAGMLNVAQQDFQGNPLSVQRVLASNYKQNLDWTPLDAATALGYAAIQSAAAIILNSSDSLSASAEFDALKRPTLVTLPDGTTLTPQYSEANFLASLSAMLPGEAAATVFLAGQDYDARGKRLYAQYGNNINLQYLYDPLSFRLSNVLTTASVGGDAGNSLQDMDYFYDPVGNLTQVNDAAQQTHYFNNAVVSAQMQFRYDAIYQLTQASGRELASDANNSIRNSGDLAFVALPQANDKTAVRNYTEQYAYDLCGNLLSMQHVYPAQPVGGSGWTRQYHYTYQDDASDASNRLKSTSKPGDGASPPYGDSYGYDSYGNMNSMPQLGTLVWNVMDQLRQVDLGGGGTAYYVYDNNGKRIRKVIERLGGTVIERVYLGSFERYREWQGTTAPYFQRNTLHINDATGCIARVDIKVQDDKGSDPANPLNVALIRYQYGNHLGSAVLETDQDGKIVSYEEYHPYGTTAYHSAATDEDTSLKRYRFSGKECDAETGLYYFGARYYASWLGRWISSDPAGLAAGLNSYRYCSGNPVSRIDPNGMDDHRVTARADRATVTRLNQPGADPREVLNYFRAHGHSELTGLPTWNATRGMWEFPASPPPAAPANQSNAEGGPGAGASSAPGGNSGGSSGSGGTPGLPPSSAMATGVAPAAPVVAAPPPPAMPALPQSNGGSIPSAPAGTDFSQAAAGGRTAYRANNAMPPGTQVQHWTKELSAQATNMDPAVMNQNLSPLQSRNALPATTLLTDPNGGGTRYSVDGGSTYGNEHKFADRALIPQIEDQIRTANPNADPKDVAVQAGRQARWVMTGDPGPDPSAPPSTPTPPAPSFGTVAGNWGRAGGAALARTLIPGFAEAEIVGLGAFPFVVGTLGITTGSLPATAAAISAAPTTFAFAVTLPALGGAVVGNYVESHGGGIVGAVIASAAVGAVIGTFIPIPGVATAAGAVIGATIGVIGYGLSKLF
jgi:RHS repeat-associated protein